MTHDLSREFAAKLATMLDVSLIHYKYYELWCDEIIESMENPPEWIITLENTKFLPAARAIVYSYAFSEPVSDFFYRDFYLACLYIKYEIKQISWATFLEDAGEFSDGSNCCVECEYFYSFLNQLEDNEFSLSIESEQSKQVNALLKDWIPQAEQIYKYFLTYLRKYCKRNQRNLFESKYSTFS